MLWIGGSPDDPGEHEVTGPARSDRSLLAPRPCTFAELDQPDSVLNRAAARTVLADPFCARTEWQLSFHEAFAPRRPLHLREGGGSVVAFAEVRHPHIGRLLEPVESHWCFGSPLLGPDALDLLDALLHEASLRDDPPSFVLSGLVPGSALPRRVAARFRARYEIVHLRPTTLCSASLEGGPDAFLSRRSARLRKRLRQAARRAAARGVHFERQAPASPAEADAVYARMLAVERASWKGIGHCGMAEPPALQFYRQMLRRLARAASGRVIFARCGERDVGFVFGALAGAHYRGQQFSFADDFRDLSIGNLLQLEQVRWLCEERVARYDMGPWMEYKDHWTELRQRIDARLLRPRSS
jgi:CelD/BcsL family acetyltransferase involved in cellulose biosynthesis